MVASVRELQQPLIDMFERLSGIPTAWLNQGRRQAPSPGFSSRPHTDVTQPKKFAHLLIHMRTLERQGGNDEGRTCDVDDETIQTLNVRQRRFRLEVMCESFNQRDPAIAYIDDLNGELNGNAGKLELQALDLSLIEGGIALSRDGQLGKHDSHIWSVAVIEYMFNATFNKKDEPTDEWIQCVQLVPCISGADGELLPDALNREQTVCRPPPPPIP